MCITLFQMRLSLVSIHCAAAHLKCNLSFDDTCQSLEPIRNTYDHHQMFLNIAILAAVEIQW